MNAVLADSRWFCRFFLYISDGWPYFKVVTPLSMSSCCHVVLDYALFSADGTVCAVCCRLISVGRLCGVIIIIYCKLLRGCFVVEMK